MQHMVPSLYKSPCGLSIHG